MHVSTQTFICIPKGGQLVGRGPGDKTDPGSEGQRVPSKTVVFLCMCAHSFMVICACKFVNVNNVVYILLDIKHSLCITES